MYVAPLDRTGLTTPPPRWPLERVLFALAGSMTLLSAALSVVASPWFLLLTALVGVNQWLFVLFGACPASIVLQRLLFLPSVLYPSAQPPACESGSAGLLRLRPRRSAVPRYRLNQNPRGDGAGSRQC